MGKNYPNCVSDDTDNHTLVFSAMIFIGVQHFPEEDDVVQAIVRLLAN